MKPVGQFGPVVGVVEGLEVDELDEVDDMELDAVDANGMDDLDEVDDDVDIVGEVDDLVVVIERGTVVVPPICVLELDTDVGVVEVVLEDDVEEEDLNVEDGGTNPGGVKHLDPKGYVVVKIFWGAAALK